MSFRYWLFGLNCQFNLAVPKLHPASSEDTADVRVYMSFIPPWLVRLQQETPEGWYVSPYRTSKQQPLLSAHRLIGGYVSLEHYDGVRFVFDPQGQRVWVTWPDSMGYGQAADHLIYWGLSFLLRIRGRTALHAGGVAVHGRVLAITGSEQTGKSTLVAEMARRGYPVLSDDIVPLSDDLLVQPGYPWLCLRKASLKPLYGRCKRRPRLSWPWLFREEAFVSLDLNQGSYRFQTVPLPLGAVYCLRRCDEQFATRGVDVPTSREALLALLQRTCAGALLDADMRALEFVQLGQLVSSVPLRRIDVKNESEDPARLCDLILSDFQHLN